MTDNLNTTKNPDSTGPSPSPPGRIKIIQAFKSLLKKKDFDAITWAEIAKTAGVNEGLIYKYFNNSRNLLHQVLAEYLKQYLTEIEFALKGINGALNKLRKFIWFQINSANRERVFARIYILEVRTYSGYFQSETYKLTQEYDKVLLEILDEGIKNGEIRDDVLIAHMRMTIFGAIEHICLPSIIFNREMSPDDFTEDLCKILFSGLGKSN